MCSSGDQQACTLARQVQDFGNMLAQLQQACTWGDQGACQAAAQAQQLLSMLMEQAGVAGLGNPFPLSSGPTVQPPQKTAHAITA